MSHKHGGKVDVVAAAASAADERVLGLLSDDALSVSLRDGRIITVPLDGILAC